MHKSKKGVLIAVIVICALIALGACGYLVYKTISSDAEEKVYDNIASSFASNIDVEGTTAPKVDGTTKPEETKTEEPAAQETKPAEGSKVTISIARGAASETAAATLAGAGLIEDAADFNSYMIRNGYDRRIHPGTFEILMGSSYEEICKIIAG